MLEQLFGSEARVRVLSLFLTHPDRKVNHLSKDIKE